MVSRPSVASRWAILGNQYFVLFYVWTFIFLMVYWPFLFRRTIPVPEFRVPVELKVKVFNKMDVGLGKGGEWEIPPSEISRIYPHLCPRSPYERTIHPGLEILTGVFTALYPDGATTNLYVRWFPGCPALVSLDDQTYFWTETDAYDGVFELIRLIHHSGTMIGPHKELGFAG